MTQRNCSVIQLILVQLGASVLFACADQPDSARNPTDTIQQAPAAVLADTGSSAHENRSGGAGARDTGWTAGVVANQKTIRGVALLTAVRAARHPEFERIVFEFENGQLPNYHVEYVDRPVRSCGSGEPVPLKGDAWLQIDLEPANAHTEEGRPTVAERSMAPAFPNLLELKLICDFEAVVSWAAGLRSPNRFRVLELGAPARIVVDIRGRL